MKKLIIPILTLVLLLSACAVPSGGGPVTAPPEESASAMPSVEGESAAPEAGEYAAITAAEAYERIQSGEPLVILDVRTADEYAAAHIPGAVLLPNEEIGDTPPELLPLKDTEILVYCRSGNRSAQAAGKLAAMGYTNVYDFGGINDWDYETQEGEWDGAAKAGTLDSFASWDIHGVPADEDVFSGHKLTMINFWATYCRPCISEMPELGELAADYAERGVHIIGVPVDVSDMNGGFAASQLLTAREIIAETGADYTHLLPSADLLGAVAGELQYVPTTVFVDENGMRVGETKVGSGSYDDWAAVLDGLLAEMG